MTFHWPQWLLMAWLLAAGIGAGLRHGKTVTFNAAPFFIGAIVLCAILYAGGFWNGQ